MSNLRVATVEDIGLIQSMASKFIESSNHRGHLTGASIRPVIEDFVTSDGYSKIIILYEDKGMIVGLASPLLFVGPRVATEIAWWVEPEYRKSDVGKELMNAFEYWAKKVGCELITMDCQDDKLVKFYEKSGYKLFVRSYVKEI